MLWRSSEIVHAMTPTTLVTRSRMVVQLSGPLSLRLAAKLEIPPDLRQRFRRGFPTLHWMPLVRYSQGGLPASLQTAADEPCTAIVPSSLDPEADQSAPASASCSSTAGTERAAQKRLRSATGEWWTQEDTLRLKGALHEIRPSAPQFWQRVAARVGRPSIECQQQAFGPARSPARKQTAKPAPAGSTADLAVHDERPPTVLPKKDGPRREQRLRAFLQERSFGTGNDMLGIAAQGKVPEAATPSRRKVAREGGGEADASGCPEADPFMTPSRQGQEAPSPGCASFFESLHTGFTPVLKTKRQPDGTDLPSGNASGSLQICCMGGIGDDEAGERGGMTCRSLLDLGDLSWQPKGVDGFICETRAQRGRLARVARGSARSHSPDRPPRAANLRRAEALFCRLDGRMAAEAALEGTPRSMASGSDDEAPLAVIPPPPAPDCLRGPAN
mmetsp:Transcript_18344/g.57714  ORF Transcript_18344/g.57714 Transcript_18344/m.57714 type:complete len:445 (-) Transcript_18344:80-1414(-)